MAAFKGEELITQSNGPSAKPRTNSEMPAVINSVLALKSITSSRTVPNPDESPCLNRRFDPVYSRLTTEGARSKRRGEHLNRNNCADCPASAVRPIEWIAGIIGDIADDERVFLGAGTCIRMPEHVLCDTSRVDHESKQR